MLPEEIYASGGSSSSKNFKYAHPLNHAPIDDGALRARLAYDLMTFMQRSDCHYFLTPESLSNYDLQSSDDEVDIMIVDGFYKEAEMLIDQRLAKNPDDEKSIFQKAFIKHLKDEYEKLLAREDKILSQDPNNVNALINKGFALANLNREEEALQVADKALKIDPDNLTVLGNKAYVAKLLGRDEVRQSTLAKAYNVSAKLRIKKLEEQESRLLRDFEAAFIMSETPSAFDEFNLRSGYTKSKSIH